MHVLPEAPKYYTATFMADGEVVATISFLEGTTKLTGVPKVPAKAGYTGSWEKYTVTDADFTVNAVYTSNTVVTDPPAETDAPSGETQPPEVVTIAGQIDSVSHLTNFSKDSHKTYVTAETCTVTWNEDGSLTLTGSWKEDAGTINPSVSLAYCNLMSKFYVNYDSEYGSMTKLPNVKGEYGVVVLKVKASAALADADVALTYIMGKTRDSGVVYSEKSLVANGSEEYVLFDLTDESLFTSEFINTLKITWMSDGEATAENVGAEFTLYDVYLFADKAAAEAALGIEWPAAETKPTTTSADPVTTTAPDETAAETATETAAAASSGCQSVAVSGSIALVMVAGAAFVATRKKKKED
jgi:hypothetical protein